MIPNCEGCKVERAEAEEWVRKGFHVATAVGKEFISRRHYGILIVDDKGNLMAW